MKKIILTAICLIGMFQSGDAQTTDPETKKEKKVDEYIGVQINDLVKQVFNFSNSTAATNVNPYLLTYSIDSRKTGWGFRFGVGYNYTSATTNDGITSTTTNLNDVHVRIGVEKAFKLSEKWSAGAGLDVVYNNNDDHTVSTVNTGGIATNEITDTKTTISSSGGGPQGWVRYHITSKVLIGTEASFYYVTGNQIQTVAVNGVSLARPATGDPVSQGSFNSPIALFLMVRF